MQIQFLYFEDCPSHDDALARLKQVMAEEGIEAEIQIIKIETDEEAQAWHFVGSPTILVNGRDIDPPPAHARPALTCRAYVWEDGRFSPLPSPDMIRRALRRATDAAVRHAE
ncbi:MAG: DUF2703 domain-containing protein [Chloroflexi bacterium]|nr:MAG: DUF2703 domain-containing protein [Chloroflexota bacterium]